jgi:preprotein translocase subunit SecG
MLKKVTLVLCSVFFFSCFVPAVSLAHHDNKDPKVKEFKEAK